MDINIYYLHLKHRDLRYAPLLQQHEAFAGTYHTLLFKYNGSLLS